MEAPDTKVDVKVERLGPIKVISVSVFHGATGMVFSLSADEAERLAYKLTTASRKPLADIQDRSID